jgi:hypothetical protein
VVNYLYATEELLEEEGQLLLFVELSPNVELDPKPEEIEITLTLTVKR